jgi:Concanavalin A-like lectin/glucanases superfamily
MREIRRSYFYQTLAFWLILLASSVQSARATSTIFGGGPFYSGGTPVMNVLRASGYTTVMLWCIHVDSSTGDLVYNDELVVSNGLYVGASTWRGQLATLKTAPTSVNRIEVSVGSAGVNDFQSIQTLISTYGTNTNSILYQNFQALKAATGADAIDYDDESLYSASTDVEFGQMLAAIGYKVTFCPYTEASVWQSAYDQLGSNIVDAIYLQCYAGGAGNDPGTWNGYFNGLKVQPGLWCMNGTGCSSGSTASEVEAQMASWRSSDGITGGFMWLYDNMESCSNGGTAADYAFAINEAVDPLQVSPQSGFAAVTAYNSMSIPTSTPFVLSNTGATLLNWGIINTNTWLSASGSGTLEANTSVNLTVSLNVAAATNLPWGQYSGTLLFSNGTTGIAQPRVFALNTAILNWPVALSGFNAALLAPNTATASSPGATAFDIPNGYCFYQAGLAGGTQGLPLNGVFQSQSDGATAFQLGPYGASDALLLGYEHAQSGTLTLTDPQPFNELNILSCSANGSASSQGTLVVNFSNGTKSPVFDYNAQDWFYTVTNVAIQGFGRLQLGTSLTIQDNGSNNPNLYETTINLAALGLVQPVSSITFSDPANAGAEQTTGIFGVSGMAGSVALRPPANLTAVPGTNASVRLAWNDSEGATNYNIMRSFVSENVSAIVGRTSGTNYTDTGLVNGTTYFYAVSAVGTSNESTNSDVVSATPGSYASWLLAANPLAYWPLNETNGSVAYDIANGYDGTYFGNVALGRPGPPNGGFGSPSYAPVFDGTSTYVDIPEGPFDITNAFTAVAWVNAPNTPPDFTCVFGHGDSSWRLSVNASGEPGANDGNSNGDATSPNSIAGTKWHMLVYTFTGITNVSGNALLYVDGVGKATNTVGAPAGDSLDVWIGGAPDYGTARLFPGSIAQVAVFSQALSAAQVLALYNAGTTALPVMLNFTPTGSGGSLYLTWSEGTLLQSTNVAGPWTTDNSTSPYIVAPTNSQMFFKVRVN